MKQFEEFVVIDQDEPMGYGNLTIPISLNTSWYQNIVKQAQNMLVDNKTTPEYVIIGLREMIELNREIMNNDNGITSFPAIIHTLFGSLKIILMGETFNPKVLASVLEFNYILQQIYKKKKKENV